jgi:secondary thiamine-phosphate synthase enzyme
MAFNMIAPEHLPYVHTTEGADDMPAHVKAAMIGNSVTVPIHQGRLRLGTWQGIYLCEHRDQGGPRRLVLTVHGE